MEGDKMQQNVTLSGFTDLVSEFRDRTRTPTEIDDLRLTFRTSSDFYVYTVEIGTEYIMMLAAYNPRYNRWKYFLTSGRPARKLIEELCNDHGFEDVVTQLNDGFKNYRQQSKQGPNT